MIDIANARALVETLKDYAEHPSSFTDISPTEADAAADLIAALLDERERLIAALEVVPGPITQQDLDWGVAVHYKNAMQEIKALKAERDALMSLIRDEIDENTQLRVLGGAAADENITAMIERVIAERGSFEALWCSTMDVLEAERAERDALARDAAKPERWKHVKTGGIYEIVTHATDENTVRPVVVYRDPEGGDVWVRPEGQFYDGRFVKVDPASGASDDFGPTIPMVKPGEKHGR